MKNLKHVLFCFTMLVHGTLFAQSPFGGMPTNIPGVLETENYDVGGQEVAYFDRSPGNEFGECGRTDDVDLKIVTDDHGGCNISFIENNEWVVYTVNVATNGIYQLQARVGTAVTTSGCGFHLELDGHRLTEKLRLGETGHWDIWETQTLDSFLLPPGIHNIKVFFDEDSFKLNYLTFNLIREVQNTSEAIFSPNGDGVYDVFYISDPGPIAVYNAEGRIVRRMNGPIDWDGRDDQNNILTTGYYMIIVNEEKRIPVTIIR